MDFRLSIEQRPYPSIHKSEYLKTLLLRVEIYPVFYKQDYNLLFEPENKMTVLISAGIVGVVQKGIHQN